MFFYVFYLQINVFNIYDVNYRTTHHSRTIVTQDVIRRRPVYHT